jgi:4-hydroxy-tetrahydrodipicolinate reductase
VLSVVSHRIDEVPGTHEVRWDSPEDSLRIEHVAHGREGFARGALRAAEWLRGRQGCFTMSDLLGF